jgi:hypothetical protein
MSGNTVRQTLQRHIVNVTRIEAPLGVLTWPISINGARKIFI